MNLEEIIEIDKEHFMPVYSGRYPLVVDHAEGVKIYDIDGKEYYDFLAGIGVNALGYGHKKFVKAVKDQTDKIIHCSNLYYTEAQAELEKKLAENSCFNKMFFSNSGSEANEGAIKLVRKYYKVKGEDRYEIITADRSFHGRTLTTVTATGQEKYKKPFTPLPPGFKTVPYNNFKALKEAITEKTAAIMLEPIQGEGGIYPADQEYLVEIRNLCNKMGIILVFDEVQCGIGRTGSLFAYQEYSVEPDIITLAKALGGGIPIGAFLAKKEVADTFSPGDHGTTFGGNPLAARAASTILDIILEDGFLESVREKGKYFQSILQELIKKHDDLIEVRGMGLMLALQLSDKLSAKVITMELFEKGFLVNAVQEHALRFLPPLVIGKEDIDKLVGALEEILK